MYLTEAVRRAQDILFPSKPRDAMPPCLSHATYGKRHELEDRLVRFIRPGFTETCSNSSTVYSIVCRLHHTFSTARRVVRVSGLLVSLDFAVKGERRERKKKPEADLRKN